MDSDDFGHGVGCLLAVVVLSLCFGFAAYSRHQHSAGIHAGRIVEHGHKNSSTTVRYDIVLEMTVTEYVPEKWWVVIESAGQRNRFEMDRYDWEAVKVGDYVRFEGDRFCGVEKGECE